MLLAPGAINTGEGTHLSTRFVGRARDDNNWTFDGIDATGVKDPRQDSDARLIISSESIANSASVRRSTRLSRAWPPGASCS